MPRSNLDPPEVSFKLTRGDCVALIREAYGYDRVEHLACGDDLSITLTNNPCDPFCSHCKREWESNDWLLHVEIEDLRDPDHPWMTDLCVDRDSCELRAAVRSDRD